MYSIVTTYNLKPADSIVVPKSQFEIVEHYIVFLGWDDNGNEWYAENNWRLGVRIMPGSEVRVSKVLRVKRFTRNNYERKLAVQRALNKAGQPYSLINYNCEHFSNEVQTGKPFSNQLGWGVVGGVFAALALILMIKK